MNEFIEQFLLESREYVEQATADLLALEKTPEDRTRLDSAFRAFHTLKGSAGIVDFTAMAKAVHAAENVLSAVRSGESAITTRVIGDCLGCLDQVIRWLDAMETTGALPKHAEAEASALVSRFSRSVAAEAPTPQPRQQPASERWAEALLNKYPTLRSLARTAIRYAPEADCFFERDDPLARIAALPGLLALDAAPASAWPPLDALDPFSCNLVLTALTQSSPIEVVTAMGDAVNQCDVEELFSHDVASTDAMLPARARELLDAQLALVDEPRAPQGMAGCIASAGAVVANVLRNARRIADADHITHSTEIALAEHNPRLLREAIKSVLGKEPSRVVAAAMSASDHLATTRVLRVDASRIDALVNLTGELTVAKNAIGYVARLAQEGDAAVAAMLKQRYAVLDGLIAQLQQSVLGMRVLPLRHVFQRFPRLLREMAADAGKQVNLIVEGGDTEADKAIVEMLFEPLLHVLRNAIDHGIEQASIRAAHRKPPVATLYVCADRRGDQVVVEVRDDGGGIDLDRVRQVALERNIVTAESAADMSDQAVIELIFEPGFSTAEKVTAVSGRGVGMDAVRTAVQRLGGHVDIESRIGQGTTVRFTLPFSVMMTRVMVVSAAGQTFGIPLDAVVETLRVDADRIAPLGSAHAIVLRNRTVPVVALQGALGLQRDESSATNATIVLAKVDGAYGALSVDRIGERMEVMLKPLDGLLAGMRGFAGSTLLGDGSVLLILDLAELFR